MTRRNRVGVVLEDGPCAGTFSVQRAPYFLRAVRHVGDGKVDLLDQLADTPRECEMVFVYEAVPGTLFTMRRDIIICPPPAASGRYRHRSDVDGEQLRDTDAWRAWAREQPAPVPLEDVTTGEVRAATADPE